MSLVAITEADREGYLRSHRALIQMIGRAARNEAGRVILYADKITDSIDVAIRETMRRRAVQIKYNEEHGIVPRTILKPVKNLLPAELLGNSADNSIVIASDGDENPPPIGRGDIRELERRMWEAVERLDFELAAELRDTINSIRSNKDERFSSPGMDKNKRRPSAQFKKYRRRTAKK